MTDSTEIVLATEEELEAARVADVREVTGSQALAFLRAAATELAVLAETHRGNPYATGAAAIYIDTLLTDLRSVMRDLKLWTNEAMTAKRLTIPGVGTVEKAGEGTKHTWDHDATMAAVIAHAREAGEINGPDDVPRIINEFAAIGYWRFGKLKEAGIYFGPVLDPETGEPIEGSGLCVTTRGEPSIKVVARGS